jgi:dTDP-4-amino-4,6-dideoxygalactose transaminase
MIAAKVVAKPLPRRKVLVPSFTFAASVLSLQWAGLEPVFCDIDAETWQAEPRGALELLEPLKDELALILLCNTFGAPADLEAWREIAAKLDVPVLVDSAPGLGAQYPGGKKQGQSGFVEVFSLHATKVFAVGEGGTITTDDDVLADRIRRLRNFGFDNQRICADMGLNAKLSEMQAAIACRVLDGFDDICAHRRQRAAHYIQKLSPLGFRFQKLGELSVYQFVPARAPVGVSVPRLREQLSKRGIETRTYFAPPLHQQPHFSQISRVGTLDRTESVSESMISLPMSNRLSAADVDRICVAITQSLEESSAE